MYLYASYNSSDRGGDAELYLGIARSLSDGHLTTNGYPLQALYGVALSPAYLLDVDIDGWIIGLHLVLSVATVLVVFRLARLLLGPRTALVVGAIAAVWPNFIFWTRFVETETLFLFVLSCFLLVCTRQLIEPDRSWQRRASLAASAAAVAMCRSAGIFIVVAALIVLLGASVRRRHGGRSARRAVLGAIAASVLVVVAVLTVPATRAKVLETPNVSYALWSSTRSFHATVEHANRRLSIPSDVRTLPADAQNREISKRALEFMREHPADYASRVGIRYTNFWFPWITSDWSRGHRVLDMMLSLSLVTFALGPLATTKTGRRRDVVVLLVVVSGLQALLVAFGELDSDARYRVPAELPLLLLAGMSLDSIIGRRRASAAVARQPGLELAH